MTHAWLRPLIILGVVLILLSLNAREFRGKQRALGAAFPSTAADDPMLRLARQQAIQGLNNEQLLHMIHTMLAAILAALLWH